jgi:aspartate ammonia-lyase
MSAERQKVDGFRIEKDPLGVKRLPKEALYGPQTSRALENFRISGLRIDPEFYRAYFAVKKAAAAANLATGKLDSEKAHLIMAVVDELLAGEYADQFDLDVFQAGAGTSYNMNVNEVIANRALEMSGFERGDHHRISPYDDVNRSQSTNDTMPTAMRVAAVRLLRTACAAMDRLVASLESKAKEFAGCLKSARTHLHDAVPMKPACLRYRSAGQLSVQARTLILITRGLPLQSLQRSHSWS